MKTLVVSLLLSASVGFGAPAGATDPGAAPPFADALAALRARYGPTVPVLDASDFRHPAERQIVKTLMECNPGIRDLVAQVKKDQEAQVDEKDRFYMLNAVEVGPNQYASVHGVLQKAGQVLGLTGKVRLFVLNDPQMQTDIFGFIRHDHYGNSFSGATVRVNAGLVKALNEKELAFAIGRELGHIKANHRFYSGLMWAFQSKSGKLPRLYPEDKPEKAPGLGGALKLLFERAPEPSRISELTADRAGLLACGEPMAAYSALAKMAAGDLEGQGAVDVEQFLAQARTSTGSLNPDLLTQVLQRQGFQPYTLTRVRELADYADSGEYLTAAGLVADAFQGGLASFYELSSELADARARLEAFDKDPKTARLDALARDAVRSGLNGVVSRCAAPAGELEELIATHLIASGLTTANVPFDRLVAFGKRKGDSRPLAGLLARLADKLTGYLARPDLTPDARRTAEERLGLVKQLQALAPATSPRARRERTWDESLDLATVLGKPLQRLKDEAATGDKESFFGTIADLAPTVKKTFVSLVAQMGTDHAAGLLELAAPVRGEAAVAAEEIRKAGQDAAKLEALFDSYYNKYSGFLKRVPFFIVKRYLRDMEIPVATK